MNTSIEPLLIPHVNNEYLTAATRDFGTLIKLSNEMISYIISFVLNGPDGARMVPTILSLNKRFKQIVDWPFIGRVVNFNDKHLMNAIRIKNSTVAKKLLALPSIRNKANKQSALVEARKQNLAKVVKLLENLQLHPSNDGSYIVYHDMGKSSICFLLPDFYF